MNAALAIAWTAVLVATLCVRSGPWRARAAAPVAALLLSLIALVPPQSVATTVPARVAIACTAAAADGGVAAAVQALVAAAPDAPTAFVLDDRNGPPGLAATVARAMLRAGPRAEELQVVWNGPLSGDAHAALGAPVGGASTITPPLPLTPDALQLRPLQPAQVGRPLQLEATVPGASMPVDLEVGITAGGEVLLQQRAQVTPAGRAAFALEPRTAGPLDVILSATIDGHRIERRGTLAVAAAPVVLVVEPSGLLAAALAAQHVPVHAEPALPESLAGYSAVVLGTPLPAPAQERLAAAVDDGLGLFVLGPGLQQPGEPLARLLPIVVRARDAADGNTGPGRPDATPTPTPPAPDDRPPAGATGDARPQPGGPVEVDKRTIAMVLVVDRSGSMGTPLPGGVTKMSYAKTSARQTAAALGEGDEVGLVTFGDKGRGRVELPLVPATDTQRIHAGIAALAHANEYTFLLSGLRKADELLATSKAAVRHIVVITDGEFVLDEALPLRQLAHEMRTQRRVTLSIVSIVDAETRPDFNVAAEHLARDGGGAFLPVQDPTRVPVFVSAEVGRALDRAGRRRGGDGPGGQPDQPDKPDKPEVPPPPVEPPRPPPAAYRWPVRPVSPSPLLLPQPTEWPTLGGAVPSSATPDAHVLLVAGDEGVPLLAFGNRGLGRVASFAADLGGDDCGLFRQDPSFPARLAQWVSALLPPLPTESPADLLGPATVTPPAPDPATAAALAALGGGTLRPFADLRLPPPANAFEHRSQVPEFALGGLLVLLLLALVEAWVARRHFD